MAFVTNQVQLQNSYVAFPLTPSSWSGEVRSKQTKSTLRIMRREDGAVTLKCKCHLNVRAPVVLTQKRKPFKVLAFRGIGQKEELGGKTIESKSLKDSVNLSYVPQDSNESSTESSKIQSLPVTCSFEAEKDVSGPLSMYSIFKSWLTLLRTETPNQASDETAVGPSLLVESRDMQNGLQEVGKRKILKAAWCSLQSLDVSVKIPLLIFIPWYLAINIRYGTKVSKELTPLWVLGPLFVAVYVKIIQRIYSLYVFTFRQTVEVVWNLPTYSLVAYNYFAQGKLKEDIRAKLWQPVMDIKNLDYREVLRRKMKNLEVWVMEKYLDFVESIWPYYCRTIRMLKRAGLN